ncbi:MAG: hypothetical protein LBQ77_05530 [Treponema sp.]|jgi:hypothetical protein|nr:hypothetical protein [Treponema sp.]
MGKFFFTVIILLFTYSILYAQISDSTDLTIQISSLPEAKTSLIQSWSVPFLAGNNAFTSNNTIKANLRAELTPIDFHIGADAILTPIAFLQFGAGARIGSGWTVNALGKKLRGIGINTAGGVIEVSPFDGLFWRVFAHGTFQFDFAALIPGDWNHVVLRTSHEINYEAFTGASAGEAWFFQNDHGENQNGFNYYGSFFLGYQMPLILNTVGFMAENDKYLYNTPNGDKWGDSRNRWIFSFLTNFTVTNNLNIALIAQLHTQRNYGTTVDDFYRNRIIDTAKPEQLEFYRIATIISLKLR